MHAFTAPSARKADPTSSIPQELLDLQTEAPNCTRLCSSAKSAKGDPKLRSPRSQPIAFVPCLCPRHKGAGNQVQPQLVGSEGFSDLVNLTTTRTSKVPMCCAGQHLQKDPVGWAQRRYQKKQLRFPASWLLSP